MMHTLNLIAGLLLDSCLVKCIKDSATSNNIKFKWHTQAYSKWPSDICIWKVVCFSYLFEPFSN